MKINTSWIVVGLAVALIIGGMVWYSSAPGEYDTFATCIKDSGTTFFGAFWCQHCQNQKKLFGKSAKDLPYTECSTLDGKGQTQACKDAGVDTYPTWEFTANGTTTRKTGLISLTDLATFTGCPLVKD